MLIPITFQERTNKNGKVKTKMRYVMVQRRQKVYLAEGEKTPRPEKQGILPGGWTDRSVMTMMMRRRRRMVMMAARTAHLRSTCHI